MNVTVRVDARSVQVAIDRLRGAAPVAVARALNRTIAQANTTAVRALAKDLKLPQKDVRKAIQIEQATRTRLVAKLIVTGRRIVLYAFRARQTKAGVSYDLGRGRQLLRGAFIATMRSGKVGVFKRRGKPRLPIDELKGPSLPHAFTSAKIAVGLERASKALLLKNLAHEIQFILRGRRAA